MGENTLNSIYNFSIKKKTHRIQRLVLLKSLSLTRNLPWTAYVLLSRRATETILDTNRSIINRKDSKKRHQVSHDNFQTFFRTSSIVSRSTDTVEPLLKDHPRNQPQKVQLLARSLTLGCQIYDVPNETPPKRSKAHKRLKEHFLIRRNRTKCANFRGNPLFQATCNTTQNS